jgi:hypothetical protein
MKTIIVIVGGFRFRVTGSANQEAAIDQVLAVHPQLWRMK